MGGIPLNLAANYSVGRIGGITPCTRIRKHKELYIQGWGRETIVHLDVYFQEWASRLSEPIDFNYEADMKECAKAIVDSMEMCSSGDDEKAPNALMDQMRLYEESVKDHISIHDFNFNEKGWTLEAAQHFVRMGYTWYAGKYFFKAHRITLTEILWNEVNITWWYWKKTNIKIQPWEFTSREMPSESGFGGWSKIYSHKYNKKKESEPERPKYCNQQGKRLYNLPGEWLWNKELHRPYFDSNTNFGSCTENDIVEKLDRERALCLYNNEGSRNSFI